MKITKIFCDICEEEIKDTPHSLNIIYKRSGYTTESSISKNDVCEECIGKVAGFLEMIKND